MQSVQRRKETWWGGGLGVVLCGLLYKDTRGRLTGSASNPHPSRLYLSGVRCLRSVRFATAIRSPLLPYLIIFRPCGAPRTNPPIRTALAQPCRPPPFFLWPRRLNDGVLTCLTCNLLSLSSPYWLEESPISFCRQTTSFLSPISFYVKYVMKKVFVQLVIENNTHTVWMQQLCLLAWQQGDKTYEPAFHLEALTRQMWNRLTTRNAKCLDAKHQETSHATQNLRQKHKASSKTGCNFALLLLHLPDLWLRNQDERLLCCRWARRWPWKLLKFYDAKSWSQGDTAELKLWLWTASAG